VFPYHATRGRDQSKQLDLANANESYDGGSSTALIDVSDVGLTPTTSASGSLATLLGAPTRVGEVGRQASHNSDPFSPGAAPLDSIGINSPPSLMPPQLGSSFGAGLRSGSTPIAGHGLERRSPWCEKTHAWDASSSSGATLPNYGQLQGHDDGPSGSDNVLPANMV
jgi:hypothetical protein